MEKTELEKALIGSILLIKEHYCKMDFSIKESLSAMEQAIIEFHLKGYNTALPRRVYRALNEIFERGEEPEVQELYGIIKDDSQDYSRKEVKDVLDRIGY